MSEDNPFGSPDADPFGGMGANEEGELQAVDLDVVPILERSWQLVVAQPGLVVAAIAFQIVPSIAIGLVNGGLQVALGGAGHDRSMDLVLAAVNFSAQMLNFLIAVFVALGTARVFTRISRGLPADVSMLFGEGHRYFQALVAMFLTGLLTGVGAMFCLVPGIILWVGLQFGIYAMVDQDLPAVDALKESWRLTTGYKLTIFLTDLAFFIIGAVATVVTCCVGYLVVLPVLSLATAVMYHSLTALQGRARNVSTVV